MSNLLWRTWEPIHGRSKYAPNFHDGPRFLTDTQEGLPQALTEVRGYLDHSDYWKLYEAAYCARGPILEIGRYAGRSTVCIAQGVRDAGHGHLFLSIDVEWPGGPEAARNLKTHACDRHVVVVTGDSATVVQNLPIVWDVVFVDGDHSYDGVSKDMRALAGKVAKGGAVLFHDYYHGANVDPTATMKVQRAVDRWAPEYGLEFRDGQGAIALYEQT